MCAASGSKAMLNSAGDRGIAVPGHRATHHHAALDALRQRRIEPQGQREVGQRPQRRPAAAGRHALRQAEDRERGMLGFGSARCAARSRCRRSRRDRARRPHPRRRCTSGIGAAGVHRHVDAGHFAELQRVGDGVRRGRRCRRRWSGPPAGGSRSSKAISRASASSTPGSVSISSGIFWSCRRSLQGRSVASPAACGTRATNRVRVDPVARRTSPRCRPSARRCGRRSCRRVAASSDSARRGAPCGSRSASRARSAMRKPARPVWRVPSSSPGPRSSRSFSAMTKPSLVSPHHVQALARHLPTAATGTAARNSRPRAAPDPTAQLVQLRQARGARRSRSPSGWHWARRRRPRSPWSPPAGRSRRP